MTSKRCTATTAKSKPCRAWAIRNTNPPRCAAHGGTKNKPGAPPDNTNALKHGFYAQPPAEIQSTQDALTHLARSAARLAAYLEHKRTELTVDELCRLETVLGQNLSRWIRAKQSLDPDDPTLDSDITDALAFAAAYLGADLSGPNSKTP